jgi:hypothetical protein
MENGLQSRLNFRVLADGMARIKVPVPLGEDTAGNLYTDTVPSLKDIAGSPETNRVLGNFARY